MINYSFIKVTPFWNIINYSNDLPHMPSISGTVLDIFSWNLISKYSENKFFSLFDYMLQTFIQDSMRQIEPESEDKRWGRGVIVTQYEFALLCFFGQKLSVRSKFILTIPRCAKLDLFSSLYHREYMPKASNIYSYCFNTLLLIKRLHPTLISTFSWGFHFLC